MRIVYAIPTANPDNAKKCFEAWKDMGYETFALFNNMPVNEAKHVEVDNFTYGTFYMGWGRSINAMCRDPRIKDADFVVSGGDDMYPDPDHTAQEIGEQLLDHFGGTLGVMQPHGDDWAGTVRICGSPWLGKEFRENMNNGIGPMWPEYYHFYADEELYETSKLLGLLWCRDDLSQRHEHWSRNREARPKYLERAKCMESGDKLIFQKRQKLGFPNHELQMETV
jgi:hypothetical protein